MSDPMLKLRALIKAQSALTRIELQAKSRQVVYVAVALVFGLLAVGMLNLAAFLALSESVGQIWSAAILGLADVILAALLVKTAGGIEPGPAGDAALELRDMVVEELSRDADELKLEFATVRSDIRDVTTSVSRVTHGLGGVLPGVSSVVDLITRAVRK